MRNKHVLKAVVVGVAGSFLAVPALARDANSDSVDVQIPTTRSEAENSIAVSPLNSKVLLVSNIATSQEAILGCSSWISHDAGKTWLTSDSLLLNPSFADPAVAIGRSGGGTNGRYFVNHLDDGADFDLGIHYKDSTGGTSWTYQLIAPGKSVGYGNDKNHLAINNNTTGSHTNYLISAWHDLLLADSGVYCSRSTNNGVTWSNEPITIAASISSKEQRNVSLVWGRPDSSLVFAAWSMASSGHDISKILFKASANGGSVWLPSTAREIVSGVAGYSSLSGKTAGFGGGAPVMTIDRDNGDLYVVFTDKTSNQADVKYVKSSNNGVSWSSPTLVHDTNDKDQFHPWVSWDDCTGAVVVTYFDSRDFSGNDNVHTYLSVKYPGESTWNDYRVSDSSWDGDSGGFAGHYIGLAAKDGIAFPLWSDDRLTNTIYKPYVSPIYLWGVTQNSIVHTIQSDPVLQLTASVSWNTNLPATGTDYFVLTSPAGVVYTTTGTPTGDGYSHALSKACACEAGWWKYIVKSTRPGFTPRGSNERKFLAVCIE